MYKYYVDIIYNDTYIDIYRYSYRYRYMGALDYLHDVTIYIYIYIYITSLMMKNHLFRT